MDDGDVDVVPPDSILCRLSCGNKVALLIVCIAVSIRIINRVRYLSLCEDTLGYGLDTTLSA